MFRHPARKPSRLPPIIEENLKTSGNAHNSDGHLPPLAKSAAKQEMKKISSIPLCTRSDELEKYTRLLNEYDIGPLSHTLSYLNKSNRQCYFRMATIKKNLEEHLYEIANTEAIDKLVAESRDLFNIGLDCSEYIDGIKNLCNAASARFRGPSEEAKCKENVAKLLSKFNKSLNFLFKALQDLQKESEQWEKAILSSKNKNQYHCYGSLNEEAVAINKQIIEDDLNNKLTSAQTDLDEYKKALEQKLNVSDWLNREAVVKKMRILVDGNDHDSFITCYDILRNVNKLRYSFCCDLDKIKKQINLTGDDLADIAARIETGLLIDKTGVGGIHTLVNQLAYLKVHFVPLISSLHEKSKEGPASAKQSVALPDIQKRTYRV